MSEFNIDKKVKEIDQGTAIKLLIGSLLLGVLFNVLFYRRIPALSCFMFTIAFYVLYFSITKKKPTLHFSIENILLINLLLLALTFVIHSNTMLYILNIAIVPTLIIAHTIIVSNKNSYLWNSLMFITDIIAGMFKAVFQYIMVPFITIYKIVVKRKPNKNFSKFESIMLGILISIPILYIVINLLAEADDVFKNVVVSFTDIFSNINAGPILAQTIIIIVITCFTFSYIYSMLSEKKLNRVDEAITQSNANPKPFADPLIVSTVLVMLAVVYAVFVYVQFAYLFGSINHKLPQGLTYAQYARKGFFELLAVTVFNVCLILFSSVMVRNSNKSSILWLRIINSSLVVFTFIMLFSAHFRMNLYQNIYGYTYLRVFTHYFMIYIAIVLCFSLIKVWYSTMVFSKYFIILSITMYTILNFVNVDKVIVNNNISQYYKTGKFDVSYVSSLSFDTIPRLVEFYNNTKINHPKFEEDLRQLLNQKKDQLIEWDHVASYNYSAHKASVVLRDF